MISAHPLPPSHCVGKGVVVFLGFWQVTPPESKKNPLSRAREGFEALATFCWQSA